FCLSMPIPKKLLLYFAWKGSGSFWTNRRIRKTVRRAYQSKFYKEVFDSCGINPREIRNALDLETQVPLTQREQISLKTRNPFDLLAVDYQKTSILYGATSGTTSGHIVPVFMSQHELGKALNLALRLPVFDHMSQRDRVCLLFPMVRTFAGQVATEIVKKTGAFLANLGTRTNINPPDQVAQTLLALKPSILGVIPTDGFALSQIMRDWNYDPKKLGVEKIVIGAEPCSRNRIKRLQEIYGAQMIFNFAGQNEVGLPGIPCEKGNMHFPSIGMYLEVWKPDLSEKVGYGEPGVPVITTLFKQAAPFLRYWTNDLVLVEDGRKCECGLRFPLYNILGRLQTQITIRNKIVMPIELENLLYREPIDGVWYLIEIDEERIEIQVEHRYPKDYAQLEKAISNHFHKAFDITTTTTCVEVGTLYDYNSIRPGKPLSRIIDKKTGGRDIELIEEG
ncbi:MAG: phenylacetate--CoA ligase family protein, partial [Candidatus Hodarchaeota archaeon]